jgi:tetraacyldisaccharide 4'-kinase
MRPPAFWARDGLAPALLSPLSAVVARAAAARAARPGWRAPAPVVCCGNATVGGTGKTPLALDLGARLQARGRLVAFLTRGHGGQVRAPRRVEPSDVAAMVGDEALLLARVAPVFVAADRAAGARAALAEGADALVMDDGLQNPGLAKDLSLLVIDGGAGFGNGRVLPAGPLREPVAAAAARCQAAVLIGADRAGALRALPAGLPVLQAELRTLDVAGLRAVAFAGIGRPGKFFDGLREAGAEVIATADFPDHHPYRPAEVERLLRRAAALGAVAVTTAKDAVRLPPELRARVRVAEAALVWQDPASIEDLLDRMLR